MITGREDGEFYSVPPATHYATPGTLDRINPLKRPGGFAGPSHYPDAIETLAQIEKPVIAKVNGDVIGFGQSVPVGLRHHHRPRGRSHLRCPSRTR